jgi:hypothetical protein
MKRILFLLALVCLEKTLHAQTPHTPYIYTIKADSVKITNSCDTAELIIENHTQTVPGFLFNKGRGRTEFRRGLLSLNEYTYLIGADTLDFDKVLGRRYFKQGGNTFEATALLGTKDNFPLTFLQNNRETARVDTSGHWLFNTTEDKGYLAQFKGDIWDSGTIYQDKNINIVPVGGIYGDARINIGGNSVIGHGSVAIGAGVRVNGTGVLSIGIGDPYTVVNQGIGILGSTDGGIAIGPGSYAHKDGIAIGHGSRTTIYNQFVCGGPNKPDNQWNWQISDVFFGSGVQRNGEVGPGLPFTLNGSGAYGSNNAGGNIMIAGGKGTGTGSPGSIIFLSSGIVSSDTLLQSLSEKARIAGITGNFLLNTTTDAGYKLNVNGTAFIADTLTMPNIISKSDTAEFKPLIVDANGNVFKMNNWSLSGNRKSVTVTGTSYTVPSNVDVVFVNYAAGQATINLPTGILDREITIKNLHTNNTVILSGLDTSESNTIATRGAITVKYTGSSWVGISKY